MKLIANVADRMLTAIVPRAEADGWSCPCGTRGTCYCSTDGSGKKVWFDACFTNQPPPHDKCVQCMPTVWPCS
jgi:hypothetical protein